MDTPNYTPVTEDELHALLDGQLTGAKQAALQARLAQDPAAHATLVAWRAQREALRSLHGSLRDEAIPPILLAAAQRAAGARYQLDHWWRLGGMAAGVVLAFGVGWLAHGGYDHAQALRPGVVQALDKARAGQEFAHQAAVAHAVYAPEVRHPVEVTAAQQEHLVQWLSKRLGKPLKIPDLSAQGYALVGGRLLPGDDGARAQFMFQNTSGERVTLYLGAVTHDATNAHATGEPANGRGETAFRFSTDGPVPRFYWIDQGFGYALAGQLPRESLMKLADAVYQQLEPAR
ncbi:anti-sigma factor family protein [Rhodoferax sediminis]|uniref:Anti-sigma factor n=1 Tax=Rhodoferax sediminis TaxID=2509614 RepID=A0A515DB15_9BURK|nr:anti-sigma factor [Rhodoferax sediminis]QDL37603.1 anti-sigma factor [Rhodoferax sediminis]